MSSSSIIFIIIIISSSSTTTSNNNNINNNNNNNDSSSSSSSSSRRDPIGSLLARSGLSPKREECPTSSDSGFRVLRALYASRVVRVILAQGPC